MILQHNLLTAIHKHYSIEEWKQFVSQNAEVVKVIRFYK